VFPTAVASQPLASAVEVVLPLEPTTAVDPRSPLHAPAPVSVESPTFTLGLENQTVSAGDAAVFTVLFDGRPPPSVRWYIDGRLVHAGSGDDDDRVVVVGVDGVEIVEDRERGASTLTVLSSGVDNEAQYTCRVRNSRGTAFTNAHLFVLGNSHISSSNMRVRAHHTLLLTFHYARWFGAGSKLVRTR